MEQCRRRAELFSVERICRIFGNIELLYTIHTKLLQDLEACFEKKAPEYSCLANAFLKNVIFKL